MRRLLALAQHPYASGHQYGDGPNWRMRVIREALSIIGMDQQVLRHGISREIYAMPLAKNWQEFLQRKTDDCVLERPSIKQIADACLERWILPRSVRRPEFYYWKREDTLQQLGFADRLNDPRVADLLDASTSASSDVIEQETLLTYS